VAVVVTTGIGRGAPGLEEASNQITHALTLEGMEVLDQLKVTISIVLKIFYSPQNIKESAMTLKEKIDTYKEGFNEKVPKETQEIMHRATNDLQNSPQMLKTIKVGDMAPEFNLKNAVNTDVALRDLLGRGPVVLNFYRGRW
jgi:hypothetical protein